MAATENGPSEEFVQDTAALLAAARWATESWIASRAVASYMQDQRTAEQLSWSGRIGVEAYNLNQQMRSICDHPLRNRRIGHLTVSRPMGGRYMIATPMLLLHEPEDIGMYDGGTYHGNAALATGYTVTTDRYGFGISGYGDLDGLGIHRWQVDTKSGEKQPAGGYDVLFQVDGRGPHDITVAGDGFTDKLIEILDRRKYGDDVALPLTWADRRRLYQEEARTGAGHSHRCSGGDAEGNTMEQQNLFLTRGAGITGEDFPDELYEEKSRSEFYWNSRRRSAAAKSKETLQHSGQSPPLNAPSLS